MAGKLKHPYTRIANKILESIYTGDFTVLEIKILLYVIRNTYGIKGQKKTHLKVKNMAESIGCHYVACSRVLNKLVKRGVIKANLNGRGCIKEIGINKDTFSWGSINPRVKVCKPTGLYSVNSRVNTLYYNKESLNKESIKESNEPSGSTPISNKYFSITNEEKERIRGLHAELSKRGFNLFVYLEWLKKRKGYYPPADKVIQISTNLLKTKIQNKSKMWAYFTKALKQELPKSFADLQIKKGEEYKKQPINPQIKKLIEGIGK